jgi:DNA-binding transcriptional LysR family regulator
MDRLDELSVFLAIAETGSLVAASRRLQRSAPTVTRALASLEDRIGLRLFERTTRKLAPTEPAQLLLERARTVLADYDAALLGSSRSPVRGVLRVTAPVQFGRRHVAPIVSNFLSDYPEMRVELSLNDRPVDLIEEGFDLGVRIGGLPDSSLVARQVGSVRRVTVASPGYLARRGKPRTPLDLTEHDTIFGRPRSSSREWRFGPAKRQVVVRLAPRLLVDDVEAQVEAAKAGRGIARVLSYQVREELAAGSLSRLLRDFEPEALPVQLITLSRVHMAPKVRAFIDTAVKAFRELKSLR